MRRDAKHGVKKSSTNRKKCLIGSVCDTPKSLAGSTYAEKPTSPAHPELVEGRRPLSKHRKIRLGYNHG